MLEATLTLRPASGAPPVELGRVIIINDDTGTAKRGNYFIRFVRNDMHEPKLQPGLSIVDKLEGGRFVGTYGETFSIFDFAIKDFPRQKKDAFDLLALAIQKFSEGA